MAGIVTAISVQAATVSWVMAGVTQPESTTAASGYVAYLFASSVTGSDAVTAAFSAVSQSDVISAIEGGTFSSVASKAVATATTGATGNLSKTGIQPTGGFGAGDSLSLYAVIFDAATYDAAGNYATTASNKAVSFTSSTGIKTASWASFSSTAGQGWQTMAVPEPTSGLLLLLGMAGLALKRKRV